MNLVFARGGAALADLVPYCWANASDFAEMALRFRLRHYG